MSDFNRSKGRGDNRFGGNNSFGGRGNFGGRDRNRGRGGNRDRGGFGGSFNERKEMFHAVCDNCGRDCEVPFKPTGGRPVYCSDCFEDQDRNSETTHTRRDDRGWGEDRRRNDNQNFGVNKKLESQIAELSNKLDKLISLMSGSVQPAKKSNDEFVPNFERADVAETPKKSNKKAATKAKIVKAKEAAKKPAKKKSVKKTSGEKESETTLAT